MMNEEYFSAISKKVASTTYAFNFEIWLIWFWYKGRLSGAVRQIISDSNISRDHEYFTILLIWAGWRSVDPYNVA